MSGVKVYRDEDVKTEYLKEKTIAVIGFGSQGKAQALCLRDSGLKVIVGVRPGGASWREASREGLKVLPIAEAAKEADIIHMLIPDMVQAEVYQRDIAPNLAEGKALCFSHGFNIHFKLIVPPPSVDVFMVAPKAPGPRLRELYLEGFGVPALIAVHQNPSGKAWNLALEMAKALGCTRAGVLETTFKDETESDLIGEQTVLVGGLMELIKKGFEVLVEEGYPPELAYFEACNEAKLIMDLIYQAGLTGMLKAVSETARYGGLAIGPQIIDDHVKENMRRAARNVKEGRFTEQWLQEYKAGRRNLNRMLQEIESHQLEKVGKFIRKLSGLER
ncbi:MAG: ketol-acid reductoisomerase [Candidatus Hecatellales archaeon]|nr:MAG: ketol-acid reductoisomerase [Candidatus Hecatellales archaeon]